MASNSSIALHPRDMDASPSRSIPARAAARPSVWRRVFDAFLAARQRQAEQAVARYLAQTGMKFTDSVEREMERRLLTGHGQKFL